MARKFNIALSSRLSPFQKFYLLIIAGFILGPFIPLIIQSFAFRWAWPDLLPGTWWLEQRDRAMVPLAWDYVLSPYSRVWEATVNTVLIGSIVTVICLAICLPAARVLAREKFRGKSAFEFFLSLPLIVPEAAIGIALLMMFIRLGLAGSYVGIIIAHLIPTIPYMVRMLTAVYQGLGRDFEEQAMILGASRWQVLRLVTLPMLLPGVVAGALFTFLVSTNIFLLTFFLGQGQIVTLPTLLFSKIAGGTLDASAAGITLIVTLPGIILLIISERFIKEEAFGKGFGN
ncbi:MAG: ABC transporter permease [Marinovum algicola]|jgi:putative spermidine/putrescine transport system permease protein|uniref:Spermidine/putrescine transport system permease protein n=1 Tax=Marinovum algicola TaxID=42444 RepID=A0A975WCU8_9RHOB|nr:MULTISPECIES: ABC transporter permease [Marinovum]AKP00006.1 ABC-type spermidine/putrescine transport system, permease component II [Marinovum algicola DG 898]MDD9745089.1 ABC transporter permease [Marinovum sp. PR37]SEJ95719.1 putative spermidine/putrescine transport system permease protein [Marinovum algicola]SLN68616.1 Inner membrane ABC transporter permease protein YcjP [Marinovum algicola]